MKRLGMTRLMMLILVSTSLTSMATSPLAFNLNCAGIGGVSSDDKGNIWIDGSRVTMRTFNENYWEAKGRNNTVSIPRKDDGNSDVSWSGPNRKYGVCLFGDNIDFSGVKRLISTRPFSSCAAVAESNIGESIYQSPSLSEMSLALNGTYKQALVKLSNNPALKTEQRGWTKGRSECWKEQDKSTCIARNYSERMTELYSKWGVR